MKLYHETNNEFSEFSYEFMRPGSFGLGFYFHTEEVKHGDAKYLYVCKEEGKLLLAEENTSIWEEIATEVFTKAGFSSFPLGMINHAEAFKFISTIVAGNQLNYYWFLNLCKQKLNACGIVYNDMVIMFNSNDIEILERK